MPRVLPLLLVPFVLFLSGCSSRSLAGEWTTAWPGHQLVVSFQGAGHVQGTARLHKTTWVDGTLTGTVDGTAVSLTLAFPDSTAIALQGTASEVSDPGQMSRILEPIVTAQLGHPPDKPLPVASLYHIPVIASHLTLHQGKSAPQTQDVNLVQTSAVQYLVNGH